MLKNFNTFTFVFCCIFQGVFFLYMYNFVLKNTHNTSYIYNLYYDYWDLIIKFGPGSTKWNTPFEKKIQIKVLVT